MSKIVILEIAEGNWEQGFPVRLRIGTEGERFLADFPPGQLPGSADVLQFYQLWQSSYRQLPSPLRLEASKNQVTNSSEILDQCREAAQKLEESLNDWLNSETFRPLKERLLHNLNRSESVRVFIQTNNVELRRLPWHLWDLFRSYKQAEVILAAPLFDPDQPPILNSSKKELKILAILGDSRGINVDADRQFLEKKLPGAKVNFLVKPKRQEITDQLWEQAWDILFFAGHSLTQEQKGKIFINETESLGLLELKNGLSKSINRGLKLAIFNSCDGLGIAQALEELYIPQVIVMREPVPDGVAQGFLKYFLRSFSQGEPLHLAIRTAKERLEDEGLEEYIPGGTWLPILCQNPAVMPLVWPKAPLKSLVSLGIAGVFLLGVIGVAVGQQFNQALPFSEQGIELKYPKSWQLKKDPVLGEVARFVVPVEGSSDGFQENVRITIEPLPSSMVSLEDYSQDIVQRISQFLTNDPISAIKTQVAGLEADQVVYYNKDNLKLKTKQIWMVKNNQAYIITYTADIEQFEQFEQQVEKMMRSLKIN
ncbi:CHAT domain-containing protein [Planktothrix pseudagardhii]|uniref:Similar to tr/Q8YSA9/Q8YSA9 n=1 Tax=Planktothrix pseudagardhii TaxID=132604 RepID=A0A9W4CG72_9CYAN|nr:CHAT domain-containing protein [Planktothrix pseudagardhii]CAD5927441.1 Similar to tr/Q8YSA9/Q8YSA9 [Planktothrix pseudagardhii]